MIHAAMLSLQLQREIMLCKLREIQTAGLVSQMLVRNTQYATLTLRGCDIHQTVVLCAVR